MSRDKQIEEMVRIVCIQMRDYPKLTCKKCKADNRSTNAYCRIQFEMERLYNAGYRKSTDLAEEIFAEIDEIFERQIYESKWLDQNGKVLGVVDVSYAFECWRDYIKPELKKKYTEKVK